MARLDRLPEPMRSHLANLPCPSFNEYPWVNGPALKRRRVSIISTAGLHRRGDRPFEGATGDYRVIPGDIDPKDLKAFYFEAAISRPGADLPESSEFNRWFWNETAAGRVLKTVKERCADEKDDALRMTGARLLIPLEHT